MIESELDDLWDHTASCLLCGRVVYSGSADEVPLCDRCDGTEGDEE